jgi:hypothetical protein
LHEKCYEDAKRLFNLNTALIQTAKIRLSRFERMHKHSPQVNDALRDGGAWLLNRQMKEGVKPP